MTQKPTYKELEKRVKELEEETIRRRQAEEVSRSEMDKLNSLLDGLTHTNIGVDIVSTGYKVLMQNQTLIDRFGDMVGKKCYKEYMAQDEPCAFCPMVKALGNNSFERAELRAADGRDYEILSAPLPNPDGTVDKAIEVVQDVTDRKRAEKELIFKENIISSSSSVIVTYDLDGNMTYGNPAFLKMWGFDDVKEFSGKPFWEYWVVDDILDTIMQTLRCDGQWFGEVKARRKNGTLFDVQVSAATVYDKEGNPVALTSTSIDISKCKQVERSLRESQFLLQTIAQNYPNSFVSVLNNDLTTVFSSGEGYQIQNLDPGCFIDQSLEDIMKEHGTEPLEILKDNFLKTFEGQGLGFELYLDGKHQLFKTVPLLDENSQISKILVVVENIDERKQTQNEREKLISELQKALKEIKTLRGILPLCSFCKKVRDHKGTWEQVDVYIHKYSQADISHSICPDCVKKHYPDLHVYGN